MGLLPTMKVCSGSRYMIINVSDFNSAVHVEWVEPALSGESELSGEPELETVSQVRAAPQNRGYKFKKKR